MSTIYSLQNLLLDNPELDHESFLGPVVGMRWMSNLCRLALLEEADFSRAAAGEHAEHLAETRRLRRLSMHPDAGRYYPLEGKHGELVKNLEPQHVAQIIHRWLARQPKPLADADDPTKPQPLVAVCSSSDSAPPLACDQGAEASQIDDSSDLAPPAGGDHTTAPEASAPNTNHKTRNFPPETTNPEPSTKNEELRPLNSEPVTLNSRAAADYHEACDKLCESTDIVSKFAELLDTATRIHRHAIDEFNAAAEHYRVAKAYRREACDFLRRTKRQFHRATKIHRAREARHRRATASYRAAANSRQGSTPDVPPFTQWHVTPPFSRVAFPIAGPELVERRRDRSEPPTPNLEPSTKNPEPRTGNPEPRTLNPELPRSGPSQIDSSQTDHPTRRRRPANTPPLRQNGRHAETPHAAPMDSAHSPLPGNLAAGKGGQNELPPSLCPSIRIPR